MAEKEINFLIPQHKKLTEEEATLILDKYNLSDIQKLPKIKIKDLGISELDVKLGDVIEITRNSFAGSSKYFRVVVE